MRLLLFVWLVSAVGVHAQVLVQKYSIRDGLPQTQLSCVAEDSLGYLWLATFGGGLAKFDGKTFTDYSSFPDIQSNIVNDLLIDRNQNVWASTRRGLTKISGTEKAHISFSEDGSVFSRRILLRNDTLICLLNNGKRVYIHNDTTYHEYSGLPERIYSIMKSAQHDIGILHQDESSRSFMVFTKDGETVNVPCEFEHVHSVFRRGKELLVSANTGLYRVAANGLIRIQNIDFPVFGYNSMYDAYIGVRDDFVTLLYNTGDTRTLGAKIKERVNTSIVDDEELIWLATDLGLIKVQMQSFFKPEIDDPNQDPVMTVYTKGEWLWLGTTYNGIRIFRNGKLYRTLVFDNEHRNFITFIKEAPDGTIYAGTSGGLARIRDFKATWVHPEIVSGVSSMDFNENGEACIALLRGGLILIDSAGTASVVENSRTVIAQAVEYLPSDNVFLLGTNLGLKAVKKGILQDYAATNGFEILAIGIVSPDTLLLGTIGNGLVLYSLPTQRIQQLNKKRGLSSDNIFFVLAEKNQAWVGTDRGIDLVSIGSSGQLTATYHYGFLDGLTGMETNHQAFSKDSDRLYVGLVDGVYEFGKPKPETNVNSLHVRVQKSEGTLTILGSNPLSVEPDENKLTFSFLKVNKSYPDKYHYAYRLNGVDAAWSQPVQSGGITYNNLMPGSYQLNIRAVDQSGTIIFDEAVVSFDVKPAYYQTAAFRLAVAFAFALVIGVAVWRINESKVRKALQLQEIKEQEKNRLRKEIARDFHDELGNLVARLINYLGLLNINKSIEHEIYKNLNGFAQRILIGAKDFVWTLDPGNDELNNVVVHLKDFGESMFSEKNIEFRFTGEINGRMPLPIGHSRQINLIFKEAMTNAFRHSGATAVDFSFYRNHKTVTLSLVDNGKGIDRQMLSSSRGISNIQARAERINAWLKLHSEPGKTKLTLEMKLHLN